MPPYLIAKPAGLELRLKIVPGASRSAVAGVLGERLKVRIAAPPEAGKANRALLELLERLLGRRDLELVAGASSAEKTVLIPGASGLEIERVAAILGA